MGAHLIALKMAQSGSANIHSPRSLSHASSRRIQYEYTDNGQDTEGEDEAGSGTDMDDLQSEDDREEMMDAEGEIRTEEEYKTFGIRPQGYFDRLDEEEDEEEEEIEDRSRQSVTDSQSLSLPGEEMDEDGIERSMDGEGESLEGQLGGESDEEETDEQSQTGSSITITEGSSPQSAPNSPATSIPIKADEDSDSYMPSDDAGEEIGPVQEQEDEAEQGEDDEPVAYMEPDYGDGDEGPLPDHQAPHPPIRPPLPFDNHFTSLNDPAELALETLLLEPKDIDIDRWEVVISPEEYLARFQDPLQLIQLVGRIPIRRLKRTYHRGPAFDQWLLLGSSVHELWVHTCYKDAFFLELNRTSQTAEPGRFALQASLGSALISASVFVHCLITAGCDTIRLKAYGQKSPLPQFIQDEPAQGDHRWSEHNEWDIGKNFGSTSIWLFTSAHGQVPGIRHYPAITPGSKDFGTVNLEVLHNQRKFKVKIYPTMVHVMKAFNSRLQGIIPRTLRGARDQVARALRMLNHLASKDEQDLGGFRIEVTVKARTLADAHRLVTETSFLNPDYWLDMNQNNQRPGRKQLRAKLVSKEGLLANGHWVYGLAQQGDIFQGRPAEKPSKQQIQVLTDILNALGWNSGLRTATKSLAEDAWWNDTLNQADVMSTFRTLSAAHQTDLEIKELFNRARLCSPGLALPCKLQPDDRSHRYQANGLSPYTVRCASTGCRHKLARVALVQWIATLVDEGLFSLDELDTMAGA